MRGVVPYPFFLFIYLPPTPSPIPYPLSAHAAVLHNPLSTSSMTPPLVCVWQADAFHSSDMDHAPLFDRVHFKMMLDDYLNFQTTLLYVLEVHGTKLTIVHPHTSDQPDDIGDDGNPVVDMWFVLHRVHCTAVNPSATEKA